MRYQIRNKNTGETKWVDEEEVGQYTNKENSGVESKVMDFLKYTAEPLNVPGRTVASVPLLQTALLAGAGGKAYEKITGKETGVDEAAVSGANWIANNVMSPRAMQAFDPKNPENQGFIPKGVLKEGAREGAGVASFLIPGGGGTAAKFGGRLLNAGIRGFAQGASREAFNENSGAGEIVGSGLAGGITSGVLQGGGETIKAVGKFIKNSIPKRLVSGFISAPTSKMKEKEALLSIMNEMDPEKGSTPIVKQLMDRGELKNSPASQVRHTVTNLNKYGKAINDRVEENADNLIPIGDLLNEIDDTAGKYSDVWSPEVAKEAARVKDSIIKSAAKDMTDKGVDVKAADAFGGQPVITEKTLWELRKEGDEILSSFYDSGKSISDVTPETALRIKVASLMRKALANGDEALKPLNDEFSFYKTVQAYTLPTLSKQMNEKLLGGMMMLGFGGVGGVVGGLPGVAAGVVSSKAIRSPTTAFMAAKGSAAAGKAMEKAGSALSSPQANYVSRILANYLTGKKDEE